MVTLNYVPSILKVSEAAVASPKLLVTRRIRKTHFHIFPNSIPSCFSVLSFFPLSYGARSQPCTTPVNSNLCSFFFTQSTRRVLETKTCPDIRCLGPFPDTSHSQVSRWRPRPCLCQRCFYSCGRWSASCFLSSPWRVELTSVSVACTAIWELIRIKNRSKRWRLMVVTSWCQRPQAAIRRFPLYFTPSLLPSVAGSSFARLPIWCLVHKCCWRGLLLYAMHFAELILED